jgi:protein TonB
MDFARQQRSPSRNLIGIGGVIVLHVIIIWALLSGLARKVVEVIKGPIEVKVIEEVAKKPPPPPEVLLPPPPKLAAPPPPYIPPPEIQVAQPQTNAPTISAFRTDAPTGPQAIAPQRPVETAPAPRPAPAPKPAPPAIQSASVACANYREVMGQIVYPRGALKEGLEGEVVLEFTVTAKGEIADRAVKSSTNRIFNSASMAVLDNLKCDSQGRDIKVQAPITFKLN